MTGVEASASFRPMKPKRCAICWTCWALRRYSAALRSLTAAWIFFRCRSSATPSGLPSLSARNAAGGFYGLPIDAGEP